MAAMPVHFSLCILADVVANDYDVNSQQILNDIDMFGVSIVSVSSADFLLPKKTTNCSQFAERGEEPRRKILCYGVARHEMIYDWRGQGWLGQRMQCHEQATKTTT